MSISTNNFDTIERLIFEEGLRIEAIDLHPELDLCPNVYLFFISYV